jgi:integrase
MGSVYKRNKSSIWQMQWLDENDKTQRRSAKTADKAAAAHLLAQIEAEVWRIRQGISTRAEISKAETAATPIGELIDEYLEARRPYITARTLAEKRRQLERIAEAERLNTWAELTPDALRRHMRRRVEIDGRSHSEANHARKEAIALGNWMQREGRIVANPLEIVDPLDDRGAKHRRYRRRPLTDDEARYLLDVARAADARLNSERRPERSTREAWYGLALFAGLRRSELQRITWADIDQIGKTLIVRDGKAKTRTDTLPVHDELAGILERARPAMVHPQTLAASRVCPAEVTDKTRRKDFQRARDAWIDAAANPIEAKARRESCFMQTDEQGRRVDLHSLRSTLATKLARAGVAPAVTQRIMRHASIETTLRHYTHLSQADDAAGLAAMRLASPKASDEAAG